MQTDVPGVLNAMILAEKEEFSRENHVDGFVLSHYSQKSNACATEIMLEIRNKDSSQLVLS